ncbi:hypothetical protein ACQ4PT_060985 [Festuca glaucescens]
MLPLAPGKVLKLRKLQEPLDRDRHSELREPNSMEMAIGYMPILNILNKVLVVVDVTRIQYHINPLMILLSIKHMGVMAVVGHAKEEHHDHTMTGVSIIPDVPFRGVTRAVIGELVTHYRQSHLGGRLPAYDGRKSLYTAGPLPFTTRTFEIILQDEEDRLGGAQVAQRREKHFKVVIKFAARADLHHLAMFLAGKLPDAPQEAIQVLDIVLRELPTARYSPVARSFYSPNLGTRQQLGDGLESWRGFYQSIRPTQMGLSLNIDMSSTAFIEPLPVIDFVAQLLNRNVAVRLLSDADRVKVCKIVEGQRYSKRLNDKQITALLLVTCQRPQQRELDILQTVNLNAYHEDPYAQEFGIRIDERLASVEARILPPPRKMVNGGTVNDWICINFSRNVPDNAVRNFCRELADVCQTSGMDFSVDPLFPPLTTRPENVERALRARYQDAMNALKPLGRQLDLLIVILPDNNASLYGNIKRICETDLGLISQCCLAKHIYKRSPQYLANVALKINVKVGGRNTVLVDALSRRIPLVSDRPTIIFGADVSHPHPGEDSSPSIAAVVASQDWPEVTKYAGLVSAQTRRQELIQDLFKAWQDPQRGTVTGGMVKELLISFRRSTGQKPQRIIFYRDGVSEGQFYQVLWYELDAIRQACASLEPNYQPPVTFVVVQKRHHTRLFANNHNNQRSVDGKSGNILPGKLLPLPPAYYAHLAAFRARFYMEPDASDGGSVVSGVTTSRGPTGPRRAAGNVAVKPLPELKET